MKTMKKVFAILLVVLMFASVCSLTAFASEPSTGDGGAAAAPTSGTITIKSSEQGTTYNFYRLFDLALHDLNEDGKYDAKDSYIYTLNDKWKAAFTTGALASYLVDTNSGSLNAIDVNGTIKYINITNANVVAFTNAAMEVALADGAPAYDLTANGTGSDLEVAADTLGYYLMIPMDASIKNGNSSGSVASLTSTVPDVDILVKAEKPSIEKTDDKITVDVGETVTYTITGTMPNTAGYETYKYIIKDEMTSGLTFKKNVKVELDGTDITDLVTIDYETKANAFSADIPVMSLQGENGANIGKQIKLTYTAVVNDNAVASTQEKNKATLEYGHNPSDLESTTPIEEEVYTAKIVINKYTGDDPTAEGKKLKDAKFALMNSEGKFYKYTAATETDPAKVEWVELTGGPAANATANVTDAQATAIKNAAEASTITTYSTGPDGAAEFKGIKDGTYYLVEFEAPSGYNRLQKATEVVVAGTDADTAEGKVENTADATGQFDAAVDKTADIQNNAGTELPSTGGIGTTLFYVVGGMLLVGAGVLLVTKKRMEN